MYRSVQVLALLSTASLMGAASAQTQTTKTVTLPLSNPVPKTSDLPFGHPKIRYQQWYEGRQFASKIKQPVRFVGLEFAGAIPTGVTLDIEVILADAGSNLTGTFAQNFVKNRTLVIPRTKIAATGTSTKLTFKNHFVFRRQGQHRCRRQDLGQRPESEIQLRRAVDDLDAEQHEASVLHR